MKTGLNSMWLYYNTLDGDIKLFLPQMQASLYKIMVRKRFFVPDNEDSLPISSRSRLAGILWLACWPKCPGPLELNGGANFFHTSSMCTLDYFPLHFLGFLNSTNWSFFNLVFLLFNCFLRYRRFLGCASLSYKDIVNIVYYMKV